MRYIFLILLFLSCSQEEIKKRCCLTCINMTISDSIPIQFWLNGIETFNQKSICGVHQACFCQPFECDDEITIQFEDDSYSGYALQILDSSENELVSVDFDEVASGVWQTSFVPSELSPSICEKVQFKIIAVENFLNSSFDNEFEHWEEIAITSEGDWQPGTYLGDPCAEWASNQITYGSNGSKTINTDYIRHDFVQIEPSTRTVAYSFRIGDFQNLGMTITNIELRVRYRKDGSAFAEHITLTGLTENSDNSGTFETNESDFDEIEFYFRTTVNVTSFEVAEITPLFYVMQFEITDLDTLELAQSDCIDLKESHPCTELISYTNSTDFDGIDYESGSPTPTFYLRIPAQFWKEENPQTQEDSELSNGVIITRRQSIQEKTLLEVGYVPNYMHKKIQKVLMHETVLVGGQQVKRRDNYEAENLDRYPLKRGSVWLTKYDSVEKNTI